MQRLVATQGARARRMLNRMCLLAETVRGEHTLLTLYIIEGDEYSLARAAGN